MINLEETGLVATPEDVARMTRPQREARVRDLVALAHALVDDAIRTHVTDAGKRLTGVAVLFSGGNDSTVLAHLMRERATHAVHANTGIGIEQTRQFVRDTCRAWGLPLLEKSPPPGSTYRDLVLDQGFPGPAHHYKMYQRLKERCLRQARGDLIRKPRRERVVFLAGRRRTESARRSMVPEMEREGSIVWVSPLVLWTAPDMTTYRLMCGDVPVNEVSDLIHMSGECLCGAFAEPHEFEEVASWYPEFREQVEALEVEALAAGNAPAWRCRWGWGSDKRQIQRLIKQGMDPAEVAALFTRSESGRLCESCDSRATGGHVIAA